MNERMTDKRLVEIFHVEFSVADKDELFNLKDELQQELLNERHLSGEYRGKLNDLREISRTTIWSAEDLELAAKMLERRGLDNSPKAIAGYSHMAVKCNVDLFDTIMTLSASDLAKELMQFWLKYGFTKER